MHEEKNDFASSDFAFLFFLGRDLMRSEIGNHLFIFVLLRIHEGSSMACMGIGAAFFNQIANKGPMPIFGRTDNGLVMVFGNIESLFLYKVTKDALMSLETDILHGSLADVFGFDQIALKKDFDKVKIIGIHGRIESLDIRKMRNWVIILNHHAQQYHILFANSKAYG